MEIWSLKHDAADPMSMLENITIDSRIDKSLLASHIVLRCGSLSPVFNTSYSYEIWHQHWFEVHQREITALLDTYELEYNPIEAYSRFEDKHHRADESTTLDETNSANSNTNSSQSSNGSSEQKHSAYNENIYQPNDQTLSNSSASGTENTGESAKRDYTRDRDFETTDDNYVHGNNGLFTFQQMVNQQRDTVQFNILEWIVNKYTKEGFLAVY